MHLSKHFLASIMLASLGAVSQADFTVVNLNFDFRGSAAWAVDEGVQGGHSGGPANGYGVIWNGSSSDRVILNPNTGDGAVVEGIYGNQQVGNISTELPSNPVHAGLWSGTSASWVDLHPTGAYQSVAYDTNGVMQVGTVSFPGFFGHASTWTGTAASYTDIHPTGAEWSQASAIQGNTIVGAAEFSDISHAGYWSGNSGSTWVDLHDGSMFFGSGLTGISGDRASGYRSVSAGYWTFSTGTWTNLGNTSVASMAYDIDGDFIVGNSNNRAAFWTGTAASYVDLHSYLSSDYTTSFATGVDVYNGNIYIVGNAFNSVANRTEAMLWVTPAPVPEPFTIVTVCVGAAALLRRKKK